MPFSVIGADIVALLRDPSRSPWSDTKLQHNRRRAKKRPNKKGADEHRPLQPFAPAVKGRNQPRIARLICPSNGSGPASLGWSPARPWRTSDPSSMAWAQQSAPGNLVSPSSFGFPWLFVVFSGMTEARQTTGIAPFSKHYADFFHPPKDPRFMDSWKIHQNKKSSSTRIEAVQCG